MSILQFIMSKRGLLIRKLTLDESFDDLVRLAKKKKFDSRPELGREHDLKTQPLINAARSCSNC